MKRRIFCSVVIVSLLCTIFGSSIEGVQAASKRTAAKRAYAKILSSEKDAGGIISTSWGLGAATKFALLDINQDKVPELIFTPDDGYHVDIVAYIKGKAKSVGSGFSGEQKYYPKKHIYFSHTTHTGADSYTYYKFTGNKMKAVAEKYGDCEYNAVTGKKKKIGSVITFAPYLYKVRGKKVSKKKYQAYVKKLLSGAKDVKPKWHKNTAKNRKKYLR